MINETKQNDWKKKCPKINKRQIVKTDIVQFTSASDHQNDQFSAQNHYRCFNTSTLTYINTSYLQWRAVSMVSIILPLTCKLSFTFDLYKNVIVLPQLNGTYINPKKVQTQKETQAEVSIKMLSLNCWLFYSETLFEN